MPFYTKPYLSVSDQLSLLKSRGLQVADDVAAKECLHRNGYYRLSAYWYPFRKIVAGNQTDTFLEGSCLEDAVDLYRFDKKLKLVLLDAIERVEIAARVEISIVLGRLDPFAHMEKRLFRSSFDHDKWISKFNAKFASSNDDFADHHRTRYGPKSPIPIWIAIELWDFGMLSHAYAGLLERDQVAVANRFAVADWRMMKSWLLTLTFTRNVMAHHGRLWNLGLKRPILPRPGVMPEFDGLPGLSISYTRIYSVCCILCYLTRIINPQSLWIDELKSLVNDFPSMPHANIQDMGFPADWQNPRFWT